MYSMSTNKKSKCKICKEMYLKTKQGQIVCSPNCAILYSQQLTEKREAKKKTDARKSLREYKKSDKPTLRKKAQDACNKWVRTRDYQIGCISCSTKSGKFDAGHFMSAGGHSQLRYNTINVRKQCYRCNRILSANLKDYRVNLIELIGLEKVEELENNKDVRSYDAEYLTRITKIFNKKIKAFKKRHDIITV